VIDKAFNGVHRQSGLGKGVAIRVYGVADGDVQRRHLLSGRGLLRGDEVDQAERERVHDGLQLHERQSNGLKEREQRQQAVVPDHNVQQRLVDLINFTTPKASIFPQSRPSKLLPQMQARITCTDNEIIYPCYGNI